MDTREPGYANLTGDELIEELISSAGIKALADFGAKAFDVGVADEYRFARRTEERVSLLREELLRRLQ